MNSLYNYVVGKCWWFRATPRLLVSSVSLRHGGRRCGLYRGAAVASIVPCDSVYRGAVMACVVALYL